MKNANPKVDKYLVDGCMRCKYGATPKCKVNKWTDILEELRQLVHSTNLIEELKWGVPCYTINGKNVLMISAFKEYASISFLKGALLNDADNLLVKNGENSISSRLLKFTKLNEVLDNKQAIINLINQAIEVEKSGAKIEKQSKREPLPEELLDIFDEDIIFKNAFFALTPGRQRGYNIYFSQPKQSQTRISRIYKCKQMILDGIGINDKYINSKKKDI